MATSTTGPHDGIGRSSAGAASAADPLHVHIIVADVGASFCGVGDCARRLAEGYRLAGLRCTLHTLSGYSLRECWRLFKDIPDRTGHFVNIHYPSLSMGASPFVGAFPFLFRKTKVAITLHEFSMFSAPRRAYMLPFSLLADAVVFVNEIERDAFVSAFPWASRRCSIIPIGTNITPPENPQENVSPRDGVLYFGQITSGKGLETFMRTIETLRGSGCQSPCSVVGAVVDPRNPLIHAVEQFARTNNVELQLNKPPHEVSAILMRHAIAILPFPDGVTDKRGTAIACLAHGLRVVTTHGAKTPDWLRLSTLPFETPEGAAKTVIEELKTRSAPADPDALRNSIEARKWPNIARRYGALFESLLAG